MTIKQIVLACLAVALGSGLYVLDQRLRSVESPVVTTATEDSTAQFVSIAAVDGPEDILSIARARWAKVDDYQCTVTSLNRLGAGVERNVLRIVYKKPACFRHAIMEGSSRGVLITYNDGEVHAKPGGLLSLMTVQMDPRDQRLLDGRGRPFYQSDWGSELTRMAEDLAHGASLTRLSDQVIDGANCWVLHLQLPGPLEETMDVWIDQATHLPRRLVTLRRGQTVRDASFSNVALNTHPEADVFKLK